MSLQYWISGVLFIGMVENLLLLGRYSAWNQAGSPPLALTATAIFVGVAKRATSRVLITLVALGYGVVRPSLGEDMNKVLILGGSYFVPSLIYTFYTSSSTYSGPIDDDSFDFIALCVYLLAMVDTAFYIWIFKSINSLLVSLASKQQGVKYLLYKNFRSVLFALLFFTVVWGLYSSVIFMNDASGANLNWKERWTVDALWELIYFVILVAICILWAPSYNSQRYAYSMELSQFDDDDEWQAANSSQIEMAARSSDGSPTTRSRNDDGFADSFDADDSDHVDNEYGGRLRDEKDPFKGTGSLDPAMAIAKKN
jgi:hypothetical protein